LATAASTTSIITGVMSTRFVSLDERNDRLIGNLERKIAVDCYFLPGRGHLDMLVHGFSEWARCWTGEWERETKIIVASQHKFIKPCACVETPRVAMSTVPRNPRYGW